MTGPGWSPPTRAAAVVLGVATVGVLALAVATVGAGQPGARAQTSAATAAATTGAGPAGPAGAGDFTPVPRPAPAAAVAEPIALVIPAAGIDSQLDRVGTASGGEIEPPARWQVPGWYADGPTPGDPGPAVVLGHVDSPDGPAVFARLGELRPGDHVEIARADGSTAVFTVDRSVSVQQEGFPTEAVYGPTPDAQLRLITCDGTYDRGAGRYLGNLVVFATLRGP